ncbi:MAG: glycerophosphodiester phosphodiesterase [Bacteroidia bacterium]
MYRFLLLLVCSTACFMPNEENDMLIIAHRGFSSKAPENTLAAFEKAIEQGADYFECDVRKSLDDKIVVIHDELLERTTNGKGLVKSKSLHELKLLSAGYAKKFGSQFASERIPTLKETLELAKKQIKVEIEIKAKGLASEVVKLVRTLNMENEVIIISFNYEEVKKAKELAPEIETMYLVGALWGKEELNQTKLIGAEYIGPSGIPSKRKIEMAHKMGIKVVSYTINDEQTIKKAIKHGVDGIATDFLDKAMSLK